MKMKNNEWSKKSQQERQKVVQEKIVKFLDDSSGIKEFMSEIRENEPETQLEQLNLTQQILRANLENKGDLEEWRWKGKMVSFLPFFGSSQIGSQNKMVRVSELYHYISESLAETTKNFVGQVENANKKVEELTEKTKEFEKSQGHLIEALSKKDEQVDKLMEQKENERKEFMKFLVQKDERIEETRREFIGKQEEARKEFLTKQEEDRKQLLDSIKEKDKRTDERLEKKEEQMKEFMTMFMNVFQQKDKQIEELTKTVLVLQNQQQNAPRNSFVEREMEKRRNDSKEQEYRR
jgi:hypothetical protein